MKIYIQKIEPIWVDISCNGSYDVEDYLLDGYSVFYKAVSGSYKIQGSIKILNYQNTELDTCLLDLEKEVLRSIKNMAK